MKEQKNEQIVQIIHCGYCPICEDGSCFEPNKDGETGWCTEWKKEVRRDQEACKYFRE